MPGYRARMGFCCVAKNLDQFCATHYMRGVAPGLGSDAKPFGMECCNSPEARQSKEQRMATNFDDFQKFSKEQLEAVSSVAASLAKGFQTIAAETTDYSKR